MICLIPYFNRPGFLYFTLESIKLAKLPKGLKFLFVVDYDYDPKGIPLIQAFPFEKTIHYTPHRYGGVSKLSYNILEGYRLAATMTTDWIFMIEDDVIIDENFFEYNLTLAPQFVSVAATPESYTRYQSWGVCFNAEQLKKHVLPHANRMFYEFPQKYVLKHFPNSTLGSKMYQQQGLIQRVIERGNFKVAFIKPPLAYNIGFASLQVGNFEYLQMPLKEQIQMLGIWLHHSGIL